MAGTSCMKAFFSDVVVISPEFCVPYPIGLNIVKKKITTLRDGINFEVTDVNGDPMFKVKGKIFSLHDRRVLLDSSGNPLITFQHKIRTAHNRWQVFRGESTDVKDIVFTVRKSSVIQLKQTKLDVFLASNTKEEVSDFRIEGSWFEKSCAVYSGTSSTKVAQMHRKFTPQYVLLGRDCFGVSVYPNVDYAFIVALMVILEEVNHID